MDWRAGHRRARLRRAEQRLEPRGMLLGHTKEGRYWRRIAWLAKKYERDDAAALKESGAEARTNAVHTVIIDKVQPLYDEVGSHTQTTMVGVLIVARAALLQRRADERIWSKESLSDRALKALLAIDGLS